MDSDPHLKHPRRGLPSPHPQHPQPESRSRCSFVSSWFSPWGPGEAVLGHTGETGFWLGKVCSSPTPPCDWRILRYPVPVHTRARSSRCKSRAASSLEDSADYMAESPVNWCKITLPLPSSSWKLLSVELTGCYSFQIGENLKYNIAITTTTGIELWLCTKQKGRYVAPFNVCFKYPRR